MLRSLAVAGALLLAGPAFAQDTGPSAGIARIEAEQALFNQVLTFVQPSHEARTEAAVALVRQAGFEPTIESFAGGGVRGTPPMEGRNVVFVVPGRGDGGREILLTAHYDAVVLEGGELADGLVDNAASVVAVVEAARRVRDLGLDHDVRVILFDQEELGLIGARRWIEAHGIEHVAAVVNSDVAAFGDTMMYGQNNGPQSLFVTQAVQRVCSALPLQCVGYPNYPPSDDRAFTAAGAPVVSLGFQHEVGAHQMWLAFNAPRGESGLAEGFVPDVFAIIHSPNDTAERVEASTLLLAAETYAAVVAELDRSLNE